MNKSTCHVPFIYLYNKLYHIFFVLQYFFQLFCKTKEEPANAGIFRAFRAFSARLFLFEASFCDFEREKLTTKKDAHHFCSTNRDLYQAL